MMIQERQNKLLAVCASIGLHVLAVALLIFSLSGNAMTRQDISKLHFTWVTLSGNNGQMRVSAQKDVTPHQPPATQAPVVSLPDINVAKHHRDKTESSALSMDGVSINQSSLAPETKNVSYQESGDSPYGPGTKHKAGHDGQAEQATGAAGVITKALPRYRDNPPPGYPAMAKQRGYEGVVLVEAEILTDGRVGQAEVRKSSGYAILDQAAVSAVKGWKFEPARKSGIPHKTTAQLPIKFVLNDNNSQL